MGITAMTDDDLIRRGDAKAACAPHCQETLDTIAAVSAPVAVRMEEIAAALWKAEATDSGTPQSVIDARTPEAFAEQSEQVRKRWAKFARAAMASVSAPDMAELVEALRGLLGLLDAGSLYEPQAYRARAALAKIKEPTP